MVFEFTELQGIMGREYARVSGENEEVCEGIFEHYFQDLQEIYYQN